MNQPPRSAPLERHADAEPDAAAGPVVRATERFVAGFHDWRAIYTNNVFDMRDLFRTIFPTEARLRGYDMEVFDKPYLSYGIIGRALVRR